MSMNTKEEVLELSNVETTFTNRKNDKEIKILKDITLDVKKGRILAIVGESGCGKSMLANTVMNLLPKNGEISSGRLKFYKENKVTELQDLKQYGKEFRNLRGNHISMIFQDPLTSLNPVYTVGEQITEVLYEHYDISKKEANSKVIEMLEILGINDAKNRINNYPHQFSGGQLQRIGIAIAMICEPEILIADEPTTGLDVTIQAQILDLLLEIKERNSTSIILITHDLGVVAQYADDVVVMYAGEIVEKGDIKDVFETPKHPYTRSLLNSIPKKDTEEKLYYIAGSVPPIEEFSEHECRFARRIPWLDESMHEKKPELREVASNHFVKCTCYKHFDFQTDTSDRTLPKKTLGDTILRVNDLKKHYSPRKRLFQPEGKIIKAVDGVSFKVKEGETVGIVGESGSGKSTIAKAIMKLTDITEGNVELKLNGEFKDISEFQGETESQYRKKIQMVFQDPYSSFNPSKTMHESLDEPMRVHNMGNKEERYERIKEVLDMVSLPTEFLLRYPHEFSGGQRQRFAIARALCLSPDIILLDEPVSALDLSVQSQVLNYLNDIQTENNISYIFISHDLSVVRYLCDYIYVMYNGRFVEAGATADIFNNPQHPYTKRLLSSIPDVDIYTREKLKNERTKAKKEFKRFYERDNDQNTDDLIEITETHYVAK